MGSVATVLQIMADLYTFSENVIPELADLDLAS